MRKNRSGIWKNIWKRSGVLLLAACVLAASYPGEARAFSPDGAVSGGDAASGSSVQDILPGGGDQSIVSGGGEISGGDAASGSSVQDILPGGGEISGGDAASGSSVQDILPGGGEISGGDAASGGGAQDSLSGGEVSGGDAVFGNGSQGIISGGNGMAELPALPAGAVLFAREEASGRFTAAAAGVSGIGVRVSYEKGVFPENAALLAYEITDGNIRQQIEESLGAVTQEASGAECISFEISVLVPVDGQWQEAQPDVSAGYPRVTLYGEKIAAAGEGQEAGEGGEAIRVYHVEDAAPAQMQKEGGAAEEVPVDIPDAGRDEVSFYTPHFSIYTLYLVQETVKMTAAFAGSNSAESFVIDESSSSTKGKYNLTLQIKASELNDPTLTVTIPKGIDLTYHPDSTNTTIGPYLRNGSESVRKSVDGSGNTVLTYDFKSQTAELGFNITLAPTYRLQNKKTYTVTAGMVSASGESGSASHSITVQNPSVDPGTVTIYSGYTQNVLYNGSAYYDVPNVLQVYFKYSKHYPFQEITAVFPVLEGVACGYEENGEFWDLRVQKSGSIVLEGVDCGTITYYDSWAAYDPSVNLTCPVLVYRLNEKHPISKGEGYTNTYLDDVQWGSIHYRFTDAQVSEKLQNTDAYTYQTSNKGMVSALIDGETVQFCSNSSTTNVNIRFRRFKISDYFYLDGYDSYDGIYIGSNVLNLKNNTYYYGRIMNKTEETLTDVKIEYTIDSALYADRMVGSFAESLTSSYPNTASVRYKTGKGGDTIYTASLNRDNPELVIQDGDGIVWAEVVYDKIGSETYSLGILKLYLTNREERSSGTGKVKECILSAQAPVSLVGGDGSVPKQAERSESFWYADSYEVGTQNKLSKSALNKGDTFEVTFDTRMYGSTFGYKVIVDQPVYYILMPAAYIYNGYTPASDMRNIPYTINTRKLTVSAEQQEAIGKDSGGIYYAPAGEYVLYTVAYEGTGILTSGIHKMKFTVGPQVDTSEYREKVYLPAVYMLDQQNAMFPFKNTGSYGRVDILDVDGDGDATESMAGSDSHTYAALNAARALTVQAYLSSDLSGSGQALEQKYRYCSQGTYEYYVYNGLDSSSIASNVEIILALPRKGSSVTFSGSTYRSQWAALLTGAPVCQGKLLEDAVITYSADGGSSYTYDPQAGTGSYGAVTHIKINSAPGKELKQNETAVVSFPLAADFSETVTSASVKAYLSAGTTYDLTGTSGRNVAEVQPCTMIPAPLEVSGVVFKDYNGSLAQEEEEKENGKEYSVYLYKGKYTSGNAGLAYMNYAYTNKNTGSFTINSSIYQPGDYVLRVTKESGEYFAEMPGWHREGNYAYYPFAISGGVESVSVQLPMVSPRTLQTTGFTSGSYLYENVVRKINVRVNPVLGTGEKVTFTSSDPKVVSVSADGSLQYVGDGNAEITVSVPQLPALTDTFGPEPVEKKITVYARKTEYKLTLHTGDGVLETTGYTQEQKGVYTKKWQPGSSVSLPNESDFTKPGEIYYLEGWYTGANGTGTKVSSIATMDYGDKTLYANWCIYETKYETGAGKWAYGTFNQALNFVYNGGTVALLKDVSMTYDRFISKQILLKTDGQSRKLDTKNYCIYVSANGMLTVDDAMLTITGNTASAGILYVYNSTAKIVVKNGVIQNTGKGCAIYDSYAGTVSISGGTVRGGSYGISAGGVLELSGQPDISGSSAGIYLSQSDARISIPGSLTNTVPYRLDADSYSAGKILGEACETDYSDHFTCVDDRYHIGYDSEGRLLLQYKVTITPTAGQQKTYGEKDPAFTYEKSSTAPVFTGALGRASGEEAGSYAYTLGTLSGGDSYCLILHTASPDFTIVPKEVDIPSIPDKVYNGAVQAHGLSDTEQYHVSILDGNTAGAKDAGTYSVTVLLTDTDNYVWSDGTTAQKTVSWKVKEASLSVQAAGYEGVYDGREHGITVNVAQQGASVYYALTSLTAENYMTLGSAEPILRKGAQEAETIYYYVTAPNYLPALGNARISIAPKPVTVKPKDESKRTGEANPTFALELVSGSQLAGGEALSAENVGTPVFACEADEDSPAGTYPITITSLAGGSGNYEVTYRGEASTGELKVIQEPVESGDYLIEPEGYVPGEWSGEPVVIKPTGEYTAIRQVFPETGETGEWLDELTLEDWSGPVSFELKTDTGAVTGVSEMELVLKSDTLPPVIANQSESVNAENGVMEARVYVSDSLSGVDAGTLALTQGGAEISFLTEAEGDGYWVIFERENKEAYTLWASDCVGNSGEWQLELQTTLFETIFTAGEGAQGQPFSEKRWEYAQFSLPENTFTKAGFSFCGWEYDGKLYQPGSVFQMAGRNMTFTAKWALAEAQSQVSGQISYENGKAVPGVVVEFTAEGVSAGSAVTGENGEFTLDGIPNGIYTVTAVLTDSKQETQTVTQKVSIVDGVITVNGNEPEEILLVIPQPDSVKVLEQRIQALIPDTTVSGQEAELQDIMENYEQMSREKKQQFYPDALEKLDQIIKLYGELTIRLEAGDSGVAAPDYDSRLGLLVTAADLERKEQEGVNISITLEIARVSEQEAQEEKAQELSQIREKAGDRTVSVFYEVTITKKVGDVVTVITELAEGIELVFEIPLSMQGGSSYCILRNHEGVISVLPTVQDGNVLKAVSSLYSTYAIGYIPPAGNPANAAGNEESGKEGARKLDDVPKTGHGTGRTAQDTPGGIIMWLETGDKKTCRKKEEAKG